MPTTFFEDAIISGCVVALRNRPTQEQRLAILKFLAKHEAGELGRRSEELLKRHMQSVIERLHDVITPKPTIKVRRQDTDVMRGFGAGFFTTRRGQA